MYYPIRGFRNRRDRVSITYPGGPSDVLDEFLMGTPEHKALAI